MKLSSEFKLPCGTLLNNRIVKAAMTERLAGSNRLPNQKHVTLYERWAKSGAAVLITGNIMVDPFHLESAGNMVIKDHTPEQPYRHLTEAVTKHGTHLWAQISHAGRQASLFSKTRPLSASDVKLEKWGLFGKPIPMSEGQIEETIERFVKTAVFCRDVGLSLIHI